MNKKLFKVLKAALLIFLLILLMVEINAFIATNKTTLFSESMHWPWLFVAVFLAPFNWWLECIRWKVFMDHPEKISVRSAFKSILAGYTLAIITPARIGDYAGRAIMVPGKEMKSMIATFWASLWQNWINLSLGLIGISWLYIYFNPVYLIPVIWIGLFSSFMLGLFLWTPKIRGYFIHFAQRMVKKHLKINTDLFIPTQIEEAHLKSKILYLSLLRYICYATQYIMCAHGFGIVGPEIALIAIVSAILMIQSLIPLPDFIGLLSRAQIGLVLWGLLSIRLDRSLAVTSSIWMINILLPAILGLAYVLSAKQLPEILKMKPNA